MNKQIFLLTLFALLIIGCGQADEHALSKSKKEFEGVITYKITYENNPESGVRGDTMWITYSKGNLIREYNVTAPDQVKKDFFFAGNNGYYSMITGKDSIYSFDIKDPKLKLTHSEQSTTPVKILGHPCETLKIDQVFMGNAKFNVYNIYLFNKDMLRVDKKYFTNWHFGNFDKFIDEAGCLYLRFDSRVQLYSQKELSRSVYEAVDIKEQAVDPSVFSIDSSRVKRVRL